MRGYFTTAVLVCVTLMSMRAATRPDAGRRAALDAAMDGDVRTLRRVVKGGLDLRAEGPLLICAAAMYGRTEVIRVLLEQGVEPDAGVGGVTPLMVAAQRGHGSAARLLLVAGADKSRRSESGQSALDFAFESGGSEMVVLLEDWTPPPAPAGHAG